MGKSKIRVLIVSIPGIIQRMLAKNISAIPDVVLLPIASGGLSAYSALKDHQLDIVVIDSSIPETEAVELLNVMEDDYPDVNYLVVRDTSREVREMSGSGTHRAIRPHELDHHLDNLLDKLRV